MTPILRRWVGRRWEDYLLVLKHMLLSQSTGPQPGQMLKTMDFN